MKNLLSSIILTIGMLSCASCTDLMKDDGSRGFANVATIVGDAENGFYCYQRHYAGLVVSHSKELAGKERGLLQLLLHRKTTGPPLPMA